MPSHDEKADFRRDVLFKLDDPRAMVRYLVDLGVDRDHIRQIVREAFLQTIRRIRREAQYVEDALADLESLPAKEHVTIPALRAAVRAMGDVEFSTPMGRTREHFLDAALVLMSSIDVLLTQGEEWKPGTDEPMPLVEALRLATKADYLTDEAREGGVR